MERMRWVPAQPTGDFILVNIPQYRLTVYENGKPSFGMNIVAGTTQNKTVIFTGNLQHVVFSPYWNVPPGILKNETLPAIRRDPSYLSRHHMEMHNGGVRQKPGPWNSLGKVKFLFPNQYNIYLHDTPSKSLFDEQKRSFSHGCIRVADPPKLAASVLRNDKSWTKERIQKAMNAGKEQFVTVKETLPVYIAYFTAWVDDTGLLNFREDVYGHDKKMAAHLFADR
jgi:murein L,D-transpeptidase YcbB/YkuD